MQFIANFIRKYPLTSLLVVVIWVLCLMPVPETPLSSITLIDKWTHIAMYVVLSLVVGYEYWKNHHSTATSQLLLYVFLLPTLMGGLLEILQATATGGRRSGEWLDFVADGVGSAVAWLICILLARRRARA